MGRLCDQALAKVIWMVIEVLQQRDEFRLVECDARVLRVAVSPCIFDLNHEPLDQPVQVRVVDLCEGRGASAVKEKHVALAIHQILHLIIKVC